MEAKGTLAVTEAQLAPISQPLTRRVVALLAGLAAISTLFTNIILPAFPVIAEDLGVGARELGLTLSSFFIAFALGQLVVGPLADRYGRMKLVLGGLAIFVVGTVIGGLATTLDTLIVGRVIQALGVCAASVLSRAIARDLFEGEALARALSLTMIATAAAPGFSPLAGSLLSVALGWRAIFILVGLAAIALAFFYVRGLGETHPPDRRASHSVTTVMQSYWRLTLDKRFILPALSMSLLMSGLFASFAAAPAILMKGIGLTSLQTGLYFACTVFVVFAAGMAAPRLAHRYSPRLIATLGMTFAMTGAGLLLTGPSDPGLGWYALSMVMFLWGMGLANPLGTAITMGPFRQGSRDGFCPAGFFFHGDGRTDHLGGLGTDICAGHSTGRCTDDSLLHRTCAVPSAGQSHEISASRHFWPTLTVAWAKPLCNHCS